MTLEQKCKLYFMVYQKLLTVIFARGGGRNGMLPVRIHREALKRTNYILAAVGEKLDMDEILAT